MAEVILIGLDPGKTVGWARFDPDQTPSYSSGEVPIEGIWPALSLLHAATPITRIILEVDPQEHEVSNVVVYECIGIIKEWARQNKVRITEQQPEMAKHFWTNKRLREYKVYNKGHGHANDATRHLLYFVYFTARIGHLRRMEDA